MANVIQNWFMEDEHGGIFGMMGEGRGPLVGEAVKVRWVLS